MEVRKFIDFDKIKSIFYNNLYLDDYKIVVKMRLTKEEDIKIENFDLTKYIYLLAYN